MLVLVGSFCRLFMLCSFKQHGNELNETTWKASYVKGVSVASI